MSGHSIRLMTLMGTALVVCAFAPQPTTAQGTGPLAPVLGTTLKYQGQDDRETGCQVYSDSEQYVKIAGKVILPETEANTFYFVEAWGRDEETMVFRLSPQGDTIHYHLGKEQKMFFRGPVGTYSEVTEPEFGNVLRYQIVEDGITRTVPAGTFSDVVRLEVFCMTCGPTPVRLERYYVSPEVAFPIRMLAWDAQHGCWSRWEDLVSVTRK